MSTADPWRNWADSASCEPDLIAHPSTATEVSDLVRNAERHDQRVKAVGSGHSFTSIAVTDGVLLDMSDLDDLIGVDRLRNRVTVGAGMTLCRLNAHLHKHGLALPNLGDIDQQTISGAVSTGTHGTGGALHGIAKAIVGLDLVHADGSIGQITEDDGDVFDAARVSLGALGITTAVTLQCVPAFLLHAHEAPMALGDVLDNIDSLVDDNDHFEFYWFPHTEQTMTKRNNRVADDAERKPVGRIRGFIDDELLSNTAFELLNRVATMRRRIVPRLNRLSSKALSERQYTDDSYRVFCSPRRVRFREMEYAVPRDRLPDVLTDVKAWIDGHDELVSFPIEVRFTAPDDIWMSTGYDRANAYIAVHQYHRMDYEPYFRGIEQILTSADGRPHWGKLHTLDSVALRGRYPRFDDFVAVRDKLDPNGMFRNDYLDRVLGPPPA
ncbi:D-arabinono-1,4-lactone oxidase [Solicola gregarius]|uniref:FAD-binding protein n=1 Tax=Solicola gregarius TaxID=2908642 RepID=A0AA46YMP8_9ACTN|nr:D-arabinono-1,4-lactone oxidase [Solicola gregarius]UYM06839.1 FAD-binding protein [Solicola gregarius]